MITKTIIWLGIGVAALVLAAAAGGIKCWLVHSLAQLRRMQARLAADRKKWQEQATAEQAAARKLAAELVQARRDCAQLQAGLEAQRSGLECIQTTLASIYADAEPCLDLLGGRGVQLAVALQGGKPAAVSRQNPPELEIGSAEGFVELRLDGEPVQSERPMFVMLRHRPTGYVRLASRQMAGRKTRPLTRLDFRSLLEQRQFGKWDVYVLLSGRVADRLTLDLRPAGSLVVSQLAVLAQRVGSVPRQGTTPARLEPGQTLVATETRAIFPLLRVRAPWVQPYRVRVTLESERGEALMVREHLAEQRSTLLEWITDIPIDESGTSPGKYRLRWQAAAVDGGGWRELAAWQLEFKRRPAVIDWLDAEGELKADYKQKVSEMGITAQEILAGLRA